MRVREAVDVGTMQCMVALALPDPRPSHNSLVHADWPDATLEQRWGACLGCLPMVHTVMTLLWGPSCGARLNRGDISPGVRCQSI